MADMPTVVRQSLGASYYATAARNVLLFRELDRILAALAEAKTPANAGPALRPMSDLDLWIIREVR